MRVLIVGCGYVGMALGAELSRKGHQVFGLRRTSDGHDQMRAAGIHPLAADITRREQLDALPQPFDWVVNMVSSSKGGVEEYRRVYLQGMRNLLDWLRPSPPLQFVYTSSTSVYAQNDGSRVDETSLTEPVVETGRVLLQTEQVLLAAGKQNIPAIVLRVAGIYGPGRTFWLEHASEKQAGNEMDNRIVNMIHRDDLARAIVASLERGRPGEIYNVVDDEPVTRNELLQWVRAKMERSNEARDSVGREPLSPARKRALSSKRVCNIKMKQEFGYTFKYPTFREGFAGELGRQKS